jgi:protein-S-isoprenylcysteine O-methyltransferase Ste14
MTLVGLLLLIAFGAVCVGLRTWIHVRRTGASPFRDGPAGSGRLALFAFAGPFGAALLLDATGRGRLVHSAVLGVAGTAVALVGIGLALWSQLAMGDSWRIGIDPEEHTALVTGGPYKLVRNPIYTGMFAFVAGFTMVVPNVVSLVGFAAVLVVITAVVHRVEEPYLASLHGTAFRQWAATTGRFLPHVGAVSTRV